MAIKIQDNVVISDDKELLIDDIKVSGKVCLTIRKVRVCLDMF